MKLTDARAYELAEKLTTIPECPRGDAVVKAFAEDLVDICRSEEEAVWVVREAQLTWEKWCGPAGLVNLLKARRAPEDTRCGHCAGLNIVKRGGTHFWCTCSGAVREREQRRASGQPDLVEELNREHAADPVDLLPAGLRVLAQAKPRTAEDRQRSIDRRRSQIEGEVAEARRILSDPGATLARREVARAVLRCHGAAEREAS